MKPQEINWNEWEDIQASEFDDNNPDFLRLCVTELFTYPVNARTNIYYYFKKKEVWPKVFTNCVCSNNVRVSEDGEIKLEGGTFKVACCLKSLIEAAECAKKQMEKSK